MPVVTTYHDVIDAVLRMSGQSDKFLHVQAGLILWLGAALVLRRPLTARLPMAVIVVLEIANELMDRLWLGKWNWPDTLGDAAATWAWPFILAGALLADRKLRPPTRLDAMHPLATSGISHDS